MRDVKAILADWRKARDEHAALDVNAADWAEKSAANAERSADLIQEASRLDPMPAEILMFAVGMAGWHLREHARRMRPDSTKTPTD